jgi:hypothetical protein
MGDFGLAGLKDLADFDRIAACECRKSDSAILVMKAAEDRL